MDGPIANGRSHCVDVEDKMESVPVKQDDGTIKWLNNKDQCHRIDGPAIVKPDGTTMWCLGDRLHREDGPAVIWGNGNIQWWLNDSPRSFDEWADQLNLDPKTRLAMVLKWNPL